MSDNESEEKATNEANVCCVEAALCGSHVTLRDPQKTLRWSVMIIPISQWSKFCLERLRFQYKRKIRTVESDCLGSNPAPLCCFLAVSRSSGPQFLHL